MQHFGTNESDHHSARKRWKSAAAIAFACALIAVLQTTSLQSLWAAGVHIPARLTSKVLALSVSGYPSRDAGGHPVVHCPPFTSPPIPVCGAIVAPNRSTHQGTHNRTISYSVDRQPSCPAKWRCRVPPQDLISPKHQILSLHPRLRSSPGSPSLGPSSVSSPRCSPFTRTRSSANATKRISRWTLRSGPAPGMCRCWRKTLSQDCQVCDLMSVLKSPCLPCPPLQYLLWEFCLWPRSGCKKIWPIFLREKFGPPTVPLPLLYLPRFLNLKGGGVQ